MMKLPWSDGGEPGGVPRSMIPERFVDGDSGSGSSGVCTMNPGWKCNGGGDALAMDMDECNDDDPGMDDNDDSDVDTDAEDENDSAVVAYDDRCSSDADRIADVGEVAIPADPEPQDLVVVEQVFAEKAARARCQRLEARRHVREVVAGTCAAAAAVAMEDRVQTAADAHEQQHGEQHAHLEIERHVVAARIRVGRFRIEDRGAGFSGSATDGAVGAVARRTRSACACVCAGGGLMEKSGAAAVGGKEH
ncbi:hypothetical protein FI667_g129, partial [Globisporangium splendens]